jgi:hypothetical protein
MSDSLIISDTFKEITHKIESYLNLKELIIENEYLEIAGDSFKFVGLLRNISTLASRKRFESFLKTFKDNDTVTEVQLKKLVDYIDDEHKAEFISNIFHKVLTSNSSKCCLIMGSILQKIVDKKDSLSHNELVCIDALTSFFDVDITNLKFLYSYILNRKNKILIISKEFKTHCHELNMDIDSITLTIEKLVSHQLLFKDTDSEIDIDKDNIEFADVDTYDFYEVTPPGLMLNKFIQALNL